MNSLIYTILLYTSISSGLIPLFFGIKNYRAFNKQLNALFIYLLASLSAEVITFFTVQNNNAVSLSFTIIEYSLIAYIFWLELARKSFKIIVVALTVLFYALTLFSLFYCNEFDQVDSITSTAESIIIISLSIIYFFKVFTDLTIPQLTNYYYFWLNSAFLLYFGTALFLFIFKSYIRILNETVAYFLWGIHLLVNITYNILLTLGICRNRKT